MSFEIGKRNQIFIKFQWIILSKDLTHDVFKSQWRKYIQQNFCFLDADWQLNFIKDCHNQNYDLRIKFSKNYSLMKLFVKIKISDYLSDTPFEASRMLEFRIGKEQIFPLNYSTCPTSVNIDVEMKLVPDPTILSLLLSPPSDATPVKGNASVTYCDKCQTSKQDEADEPFSDYNMSNLVKDLSAGYEESVLFDVKLKVADHELPAHKFLLACRSPVFRKMFEEDMKEKRENVAVLPNMEVSTAKELLRFIYTEKLFETSVEAVMKLFVAADRFDIPTLKDLCRRLMINDLSVQNVSEMAVLADLHSDKLLDEATEKFLKCNITEVCKTPEWQNLKHTKPVFCFDLLEKVLKMNDDK